MKFHRSTWLYLAILLFILIGMIWNIVAYEKGLERAAMPEVNFIDPTADRVITIPSGDVTLSTTGGYNCKQKSVDTVLCQPNEMILKHSPYNGDIIVNFEPMVINSTEGANEN